MKGLKGKNYKTVLAVTKDHAKFQSMSIKH